MLYGLYLSAMGLQVQEYRQGIVSNNLANAQTTGFKRDLAVFQARANAVAEDPAVAMLREPTLAGMGGGVWASPTALDLTAGPLEKTGRDQDVAIEGSGFLTVEGKDGQGAWLTRDGRMTTNTQGELVAASSGARVLGADGKPIKVNPGLEMAIDEAGHITQAGTVVGQLGLADVASGEELAKRGGGLMSLKEGAKAQAVGARTTVKQGWVEGSAVDPMTEMVVMLEGQRAYEANARMITYQDQTLQQLNTVGRVA